MKLCLGTVQFGMDYGVQGGLRPLEEAVSKARELAEEGDVVTLSPACASFDMFPNFAVRGNVFKEIVMNMK